MDKVIIYPEGLRLVVESMPSFRSIAAGIWVGTGSANERERNNGISHFIEHMIFKGTDKLSAFEIANSFEKLGASINAFTGKECTCYYFKTIDESLVQCMELLSNIFFDSVFSEDELERERKVVIEEINMTEDSPEDICYDLISRASYGDHPLGYTILGPKENILSFGKADIEQYMSEHYMPENMVISMAGNVTLETADKIVRRFILPKLRKGKLLLPPAPKTFLGSCVERRIKDFEQANIALSFPSVRFNDEKFPVQGILNMILGGGMSSRLFQNIREKQGLAYSVYSSPSSFTSSGTFNIYLNISECNTEKALTSTFDELKKIVSESLSEEEFLKAKTQIKAACVFAQENLQTVMSSLGKLMTLSNEVYDIDKRLMQFEKVTRIEVEDLAREIFISNNTCAAYVGRDTTADIEKLISQKSNSR